MTRTTYKYVPAVSEDDVSALYREINSGRTNHQAGNCYHKLMKWTPEVKANRPAVKNYKCKDKENWLKIYNGTVKFPSQHLKCTAQTVIRVHDNENRLGSVQPLKDGDSVPADGFHTHCVDHRTNSTQEMLYGGVLRHPTHVSHGLYTGPHYNILLVCLDSVSRLEFQRSLENTVAFFQTNLTGEILQSYNIVGDGTPAALQPILTGKNEEELPEARRGHKGATYVDHHPWIFHRLHKLGYVTQWMEEQTDFGTFQLRMLGFRNPPVHHYLRPYMIEQNKFAHGKYCVGSEQQIDRQFLLIKELFRVYRDKPKFSFVHMADISHNNVDFKFLDNHFVQFMKWLLNNGHMENTLLILFADHGARFSQLRKTLQGRLEERLPMMGLALPWKLRRDYPHLYGHLRDNVHRLSSPYDIHATLHHLLDITNNPKQREAEERSPKPQINRGASLLRPVSEHRSCADAQILPHWCACSDLRPVRDLHHRIVTESVAAFLRFVNLRTAPQRVLCHELRLQQVFSAQMGTLPQNMLKFMDSKDDRGISQAKLDGRMQGGLLKITLETVPNNARYDVTVLWYRGAPGEEIIYHTGEGYVSRTNAYGSQPNCIIKKFPHMREYCLCK